MGFDVVSKFLAAGGKPPAAHNDNLGKAEFSEGEKAYVADTVRKYGLVSRTYEEDDGERIDIFLGRMEQQYNIPSLALKKHPEIHDRSPYKFFVSGYNGCMVPSNSFSGMQTLLAGFLLKHFQNRKLRSLDT